jgi:hypothetical protein
VGEEFLELTKGDKFDRDHFTVDKFVGPVVDTKESSGEQDDVRVFVVATAEVRELARNAEFFRQLSVGSNLVGFTGVDHAASTDIPTTRPHVFVG